ncbi:hypothetical protein Lser_V15G05310 [Lactuca serriola]
MVSHSSKNHPQVDQSNPDSYSSFSSSNPLAPSMYPSLETKDLVEKLFPNNNQSHEQEQQSTAFESSDEFLIKIHGLIVHSIDKQQSIQLASGVFEIIRIRQGDTFITTLVRVVYEIQWSLAKDEAVMKLDSLMVTENSFDELDRVLEEYNVFSVKEAERDVAVEGWGSPRLYV